MAHLAGGYSGVPRYALALSQALDRVALAFEDLELTLATTPEGAERVAPTSVAVALAPFGGKRANAGPGRIALEQFAARFARADLLHFFDINGPVLAPRRPFLATVHDVSVLRGLRPRKHEYKRRLWPWVTRRARRLVAISEFARDEAMRLLHVPAEKLEVIPSGPGFTQHANGQAAAGIEAPYFLYVGLLAVNKNLPFLVRAFDGTDGGTKLVLAGKASDGYADLQDAIAASARRDDVIVLSEVPDDRLDALYREAVALVHPATYEGFGFTPLEAMARDCPVLASDIPALREVVGDAAALLPLDQVDTWAAAMTRIASDADWQTDLRATGRVRVARYSWDETARSLCRLFMAVGRDAR